jgi:hypothetical protein
MVREASQFEFRPHWREIKPPSRRACDALADNPAADRFHRSYADFNRQFHTSLLLQDLARDCAQFAAFAGAQD